MKKEIGFWVKTLSWAGLVGVAFGALKLNFPDGTIFYKEIEHRAGQSSTVSGSVVEVPNDSTAFIYAEVGNKRFEVRAQDGGVRGGAKAVVDVMRVSSTKFTRRGSKPIKGIEGMSAAYS